MVGEATSPWGWLRGTFQHKRPSHDQATRATGGGAVVWEGNAWAACPLQSPGRGVPPENQPWRPEVLESSPSHLEVAQLLVLGDPGEPGRPAPPPSGIVRRWCVSSGLSR